MDQLKLRHQIKNTNFLGTIIQKNLVIEAIITMKIFTFFIFNSINNNFNLM